MTCILKLPSNVSPAVGTPFIRDMLIIRRSSYLNAFGVYQGMDAVLPFASLLWLTFSQITTPAHSSPTFHPPTSGAAPTPFTARTPSHPSDAAQLDRERPALSHVRPGRAGRERVRLRLLVRRGSNVNHLPATNPRRRPSHHVQITGSVVLVFSIFMLSLVQQDQYYQVFLAQGLGIGLGVGLLFLPSLSIVAHHFRRRRALATGLVVSGASCGGIVYPILLNHLFENPKMGFANAVRVSGALVGGLLAIANCLMRTRLPPKRGSAVFTRHGMLHIASDGAYVTSIAGYVQDPHSTTRISRVDPQGVLHQPRTVRPM